jgi:hypothetical protein
MMILFGLQILKLNNNREKNSDDDNYNDNNLLAI